MKNKNCKKCKAYNALYRKIFFKFCVENHGICHNSQTIVRGEDSCKLYQPQNLDIKIVINLLDNAIRDINELKNYCSK